jgi:hypothetical protein
VPRFSVTTTTTNNGKERRMFETFDELLAYLIECDAEQAELEMGVDL